MFTTTKSSLLAGKLALSARAVEYVNCISAEGKDLIF